MKKVVKIHEKNPAFLLSLLPLLSIANSDDIVSGPFAWYIENLLNLAVEHSQSGWSCCWRQKSWWWLYSGKISTKIKYTKVHRSICLGILNIQKVGIRHIWYGRWFQFRCISQFKSHRFSQENCWTRYGWFYCKRNARSRKLNSFKKWNQYFISSQLQKMNWK